MKRWYPVETDQGRGLVLQPEDLTSQDADQGGFVIKLLSNLQMMIEDNKNVLKCKLAVPCNCLMKGHTCYCSVTHGYLCHLWLP